MLIHQFRAAPPLLQHALVESQGVFLLKKCSGTRTAMLYHLNDFYVEVLYPGTYKSRGIIRCFSVGEINGYLRQIDISAIHHLLQ